MNVVFCVWKFLIAIYFLYSSLFILCVYTFKETSCCGFVLLITLKTRMKTVKSIHMVIITACSLVPRLMVSRFLFVCMFNNIW